MGPRHDGGDRLNIWLPFAALILGLPALGLWAVLVGRGLRLREAALWTAIAWATYASLGAELLSFGAGHDLLAPHGGNFTRVGLAAIWLIPAIAAAVVVVRNRSSLRQLLRDTWTRVTTNRGLDRFLIAAVAFCAGATLVLGLLYAPNTWDSMTYHLARVTSWLQLGGVRHYATNAEPQLFHPPGSEVLIAQWQALTGGDRLAASVQWGGYVVAIIAASLIAARLGGARRAQLLAAFFTATTPMALLQASSTQNDLVTAGWLLAAGALALQALEGDGERLAAGRLLLASTAIGLAILTKGTALLYGPWILLLIAWVGIRRLGAGRAVALGLACLVAIGLLNAGHWLRNNDTYGTPVYSGSGVFDYSNDSHSPSAVFSNLVRNGAIYFGTPSESANTKPANAVRSALETVGINPDDPATTFYGQVFHIDESGPQESHAPGLLMLLLSIWAIGAVLLWRRLRTPLRLTWALIVLAQIVSFALMIKWQPWHSRLHLPFVLMAAPLVALLLGEMRRGWIATVAVALAALAAPIYLFANVDRPLVGEHSLLITSRDDQYFTPRRDLLVPYEATVSAIEQGGFESVAMSGNFDDWFYPFDPLTDQSTDWAYALVDNESNKYAGSKPAAVVCVNCDEPRKARLVADGYTEVASAATPPQDAAERATAVSLWSRDN